jgi:hypothetical protein
MVGPSKEAVREEMTDWLNNKWDFPEHSDCSRESAIMGSVDECVAQLKEHVAVGVQKSSSFRTIPGGSSGDYCEGNHPKA